MGERQAVSRTARIAFAFGVAWLLVSVALHGFILIAVLRPDLSLANGVGLLPVFAFGAIVFVPISLMGTLVGVTAVGESRVRCGSRTDRLLAWLGLLFCLSGVVEALALWIFFEVR